MALATFPRAGATTGTDRLLAFARFYGRDAITGDDKSFFWSGHMLWDPASYEGGPKDVRVLEFGYYERPMSGPRGDVRLSNVTLQLTDLDRLLRGMLDNAKQYALINTEVVVKAILESEWRAGAEPVTLFRGLVNSYDLTGEFLWTFDFKDWLGNRLAQPLPMVQLTTDLLPNLPSNVRGIYAPYLYGRMTDDASIEAPPTIISEPARGSYADGGIYPIAGFAAITDCTAAPPSGIATALQAGGALSVDAINSQYGFLLASIDGAGKLSDPVPFYYNVDYAGTRGSFVGTPVPYQTVDPGDQQIEVMFTPGAGAVATRVWIGTYYYGAQWTYYIDVPAPGGSVVFDAHPAFLTPATVDNITVGGVLSGFLARGGIVVAAVLDDGETPPSSIVQYGSYPYRRPLRVAWSHPTATDFAVYRTLVAGPPARTDWTKRAETTDTFFEFYPEGTEFDDVSGLFSGTGRVPVIYVGPYTAPITGGPWEAFLVCYGVAEAIQSAFQGGVKVDPGNYNTTWAVPGLGTIYASEFGADPFVTLGGLRFTLIFLRGPDADAAKDGTRKIVLNVVGYELIGDGSGTAISSLYQAFLHLLKNQVMREVPQITAGGDWLAMPQWSDGTDRIDSDSFDAAEAESAPLIGSPAGGFLITAPATIGEWIRKLLLGLDCGFGWNREGQAIIQLLPPAAAALPPAELVDAARDVIKGSFRIKDDETQLFNLVPYAYDFDYTANAYGRTGTEQITLSQTAYRATLTAPTLELFGRLGTIAAKKIAGRAVQRSAKPERTIIYLRGLAALDLDNGARYRLTHPEGAAASGFIDRLAQVNKIRFHVEDGTVEVSSWDLEWLGVAGFVEYLLEEIMAELDLGGSRTQAQLLTNSNPQTIAMMEAPAAPVLVQWQLLPDDAVVTCFVSGRVDDPAMTARVYLYNETDAAAVVGDVSLVATADADGSFTVPRPLDGLNKAYSARADISATGGLVGVLSDHAAFVKAKIRTTFTP